MRIDMQEIEKIGGVTNGKNRDIAHALYILALNSFLLPDTETEKELVSKLENASLAF
ncbi:MAG: hypothetical protein ACREF8_01740 [Chthoniobacterales bacterium]